MRIMTREEGDCNVVKSRNGSIQADFLAWKVKFMNRLQTLAKGEKKKCSGKCKSGGSCKNKKRDRKVEEEEDKAAQQNNSSEVKIKFMTLHYHATLYKGKGHCIQPNAKKYSFRVNVSVHCKKLNVYQLLDLCSGLL